MKVSVGVQLIPFDRAHIEKARAWRNQYEIWRWCRQSDVISDADQEDWYERQRKDPTIRMYAIAFRTGSLQEIVGVCGFTSLCFQNRRAEFSCYIGTEHQGQGFGAAALQALLKHGFTNLGLNVIWGECFEGNPALNLFAKIGFVLEGTRRSFYWKDGRFINAHLVSMDRDTWTSLTSQSSQPSPPTTPASSSSSGPSEEELKAEKQETKEAEGFLGRWGSGVPRPQSAESP